MADRRRIVRIDAAGTITTIRDLEDGANYFSIRDSFKVNPSNRKTIWSASQRRYGGARAVGETHDNGEISWAVYVKNTTEDLALASVAAMLGDLEYAGADYYFEWRPDGASNSTYFEIRGPAQYTPNYSWQIFDSANNVAIQITLPVGPLALRAPQTIPFSSTTMPAVVALSTAILGDAPALCYASLTTSGGTSPPIFALIGWTKRPGSSAFSPAVAPFGVIEAETSNATPVVWAVTADATYRGGSGLKGTASGAQVASSYFLLDPSLMQPDDFTRGEIDIEFWGRFEIPSTLVSPSVVLQAYGNMGQVALQNAAEYGPNGHYLTKPSSGSAKRFVKIGTATYPVDTVNPVSHWAAVHLIYQAGSSGTHGFDYLVAVPARQRALSPTGKANNSAYPKFIPFTVATTKTIRSDLSGQRAEAAGRQPDPGLGGSPLELPVGNVDLLVKLSSLVPDDPTSDTTSEQLSHSVSGSLLIFPRVWLARST